MTAWEVERERTYDVGLADLPVVHQALAPAGGILHLAGRTVTVAARPADRVLHVYTRRGWEERTRVVIELTGRGRIRLSEKRWADVGGEAVKLDRRRWVGEPEAWELLAGRWLVAFVKVRLAVRLVEPALRVRIDVMTPVDAAGVLDPARTFAQLEIEARAPGADPAVIEDDPTLWSALGPRLAPAAAPKAELAADDEPPPVWSAAETAARVRALAAASSTLLERPPMPELLARHGTLAE